MKPKLLAFILVVVVVVIGLGVFLNGTLKSTSSITTSASTSGSSVSTICEVPDTGGGVFLQLISSSGNELGNISVLATPKAASCFGEPPLPQTSQQETNSSGWISLAGLQANYYYNIELTFQNMQYNFTLPQGPGEITMATYNLPAGNLSINMCFTQPQSCNPYTSISESTPQVTVSTSISHD